MAAGDDAAVLRVAQVIAHSALSPVARLRALAQAEQVAKAELRDQLCLRRCRLSLDLARAGQVSLATSELVQLGRTLERLGEPVLASGAYELAGDTDAQAAAYVRSGAVDELSFLLVEQQARERRERHDRAVLAQVDDLIRVGARRRALELAEQAGDATLALSQARHWSALGLRRRLELETTEGRTRVVFGQRITLGRAGDVIIGAPAASREHVAIERTGPRVTLHDLGSRNGTRIAGVPLAGPFALDHAVVLELGADVHVQVARSEAGVVIRWGELVVCAPLGALRVGAWSIQPGPDHWLELHAPPEAPAYHGPLRLEPVVQLCDGDVFSAAASGPAVMRVFA